MCQASCRLFPKIITETLLKRNIPVSCFERQKANNAHGDVSWRAGVYTFVHDGQCASGWIKGGGWNKLINTPRNSMNQCLEECKANAQCGYFAYDPTENCCILYTTAGGCPDDDDTNPSYNSYRLNRALGAAVSRQANVIICQGILK